MYIRLLICAVGLLVVQNGCMLIDYDSVTDSSALDSGIDSADASGGASIDGTVSDATGAQDSSLPDAIDAAETAIVSDGSMDSPQSDDAETGTDSNFDDAPTDNCQPGDQWCDGDRFMSCNASGVAEVEQDCSTLSNSCEIGTCNESENSCEKSPRSSGTRWCDDAILMGCNGQGSSEVVKDCASESDRCNTGVCNSTSRQCEIERVTDSVFWCEYDILYTCDSDGSSVVSQDCNELDDWCNIGHCDEAEDRCYVEPEPTDTVCLGNGACDDSGTCLCSEPNDSWCNGNSLINCDGTGKISTIKDCGSTGNDCNTGVCDSESNSCTTIPVNDATCGVNGTCDIDGNCVMNTSNCSSDSECFLTCSSDISPCILNCGDVSGCSVTCEEGSTCAIDCASAGTCNVTCDEGATCSYM